MYFSHFLPCFFEWQENETENPEYTLPEKGNDRLQQGSKGEVPKAQAQQQTGTVGKARIATAEPEDQLRPDGEQRPKKQQVGKPTGPQRLQTFIDDPQSAAQQQRLQQMQPGIHPNSRRRKPSGRGSS